MGLTSTQRLAAVTMLFIASAAWYNFSGALEVSTDPTFAELDEKRRLERLVSEKKSELIRLLKATPNSTAPAAPSSSGHIGVTAAVVYLNYPALVNGNDAEGMLYRAQRKAFDFTFGPGDRKQWRPFVDLTAIVKAQCEGQTKCSVEIGHENLPHGKLVDAKRIRAAVDYSCGGKAAEFEYHKNMHPPGSRKLTFALTCEEPTVAVEIQTPCAGILCAVPYEGFHVWPISFSIPRHNFRWSQSWKSKDFADSIPGNGGTYTSTQSSARGAAENYEPDVNYFKDYTHSFYCVTRKKKGWDALRHYEILATGCVPYFVDIAMLPANTMAFFPRDLVWDAMNLPGVTYKEDVRGSFWFKESFSIDKTAFNETKYFELASKIQLHARKHLSSDAMAKYVLEAMQASGAPKVIKKVLYIHHCYHDFLSDSLWSGFKELEIMGDLDLVADVVPPRELSLGGANGPWGRLHSHEACPVNSTRKRQQTTNAKTLKKAEYYGWVSGWANHRPHNEFPEETMVDASKIPDRIKAKEFDVVIYATPSRTDAWMNLVKTHYPRTSVAFLLGGDAPDHHSTLTRLSKHGIPFMRELYDDASATNHEVCQDAPGAVEAHDVDCCIMSDNANVMWPSKKYNLDRWALVAKENEEFTCSTSARFGDTTGDRFDYIDIGGKPQRLSCNLGPKGPFKEDKAPGWAKKCHCKSTAATNNDA